MSELGDRIVKGSEHYAWPSDDRGKTTAAQWAELRAELIALRRYHTLSESFGPIRAANTRTEQWQTQAIAARKQLKDLHVALEALAAELAKKADDDGEAGLLTAANLLKEFLDEHAG